jgi:hypothetical protein
MARKPKSGEYEVGYRKPPVEHQFGPGGKKPFGSGRKKGVKNLRTHIDELLSEKVQVTLGGETKTMTKRELLVRVGFEKAIKASSVNELNALMRLYETLAPGSVDPPLPIVVESMSGDEGL